MSYIFSLCEDMAFTGELKHSVKGDCLILSPMMPFALVKFNGQTLWAFRPSGEVVWEFELNQLIERVIWRPDGLVLAIFGERGLFRLVNIMSGKTELELDLGFKVNYGHWCSIDSIGLLGNSIVNDPIKDILPILDGVSHDYTIKSKGSDLDFMILATNLGLSLIFSNTFIINLDLLMNCNVKCIVPNGNLKTQYLMVEKENNLLDLIQLDLSFIGSSTREITSMYGKILEIMLIIRKTLNEIEKVHTPFIEYTFKIMQLLKEEQQDETQPIDDLYDLLLTGNLSDGAKKWLTDYLGDRGIKRWVKLGQTYFEFSKKSVFLTFISSMTHLITHLNKLGLVDLLNIPNKFLKECYKFIVELNEFQFQFKQTINWLEMILKEIAGDQPPKNQIIVKDVVKFLLFANSLIGEGIPVGSFRELFEQMELSLNKQIENVKNGIKSNVEISKSIEIGKMGESIKMALIDDNKLSVLIKRGDTLELKVENNEVTFRTFEGLIDFKMLRNGQIVIIQTHLIRIFDEYFKNEIKQHPVATEISQFDINMAKDKADVVLLNGDGKHFEWIEM